MFGRLRFAPAYGVACAALGLLGCTGQIEADDELSPGATSGGSGFAPNGGRGSGTGGGRASGGSTSAPTAGASSGGGNAQGGGGGAGASTPGTGGSVPISADPEIPARIRRLANAEYDTSVQVLLNDGALLPSKDLDFTPDARQAGFTLNDAQRVDPVVAKQYAAAANALAETVKARVSSLAPCSDPNPGETCARSFIEKFGAKVYRRPLTQEEIDGPAANDGLLDLYRVGAEGATYADGIEVVVRGMLQSAGFLYLTELGAGTGAPSAGTKLKLTPHELASALSYLVMGGPPQDDLLNSALAGELDMPEARGRALDRMLDSGGSAERRMVRLMQEWLGIDRLSSTSKDSTVYAKFDAVKAPLQRESQEFIAQVLKASGNVSELLGADYTYSNATLEPPLQELYGVGAAQGKVPLNRRGILNQGAFLSVYAHAHESGPVLRGVTIAKRILCLPLRSPTELNIVVVPPVPDPSKTTRERFAIHSKDAACAGCHALIDPLGFAFEQYDGMGQFRTQEVLPNQSSGPPVDSHVVLASGTPIDGEYADSDELAVALAGSPAVRECFARHLFRGSIGRSDGAVFEAENAFVRYWQEAWDGLPADQRGNADDQGNYRRILRALVQNPFFTQRIVKP